MYIVCDDKARVGGTKLDYFEKMRPETRYTGEVLY
jgi:hypothetical protein